MLRTSLLVFLLNQAWTQATNFQCVDSDSRIQLHTETSTQCQGLVRQCLGETVTEQLVDKSASFTCLDQSTGNISFVRKYGDTETPITNGGRFTISGQTLTISNIQPGDEGEYICPSSAGCLTVSGLAHFRTCGSNFSSYTQEPTFENSCSQNLKVTEGERVTLDTRLLFGERGYCQCIQEVTLLRVKRGSYSSLPIFNCAEVGNNCNNTVINGEEFIVERSLSGQPYDFSLVLPPVDMSSIYYVEVEVMQPGVTSRPRFWKIFNVTVYPAPTTTMMPVDTNTTPQTTVMDTTGVSTVDTTTPTELTATADNAEAGSIAGGVISGVLLLGFLTLAVLLLVIGILVYKNHRPTHSENIYAEIVVESRKRSPSDGRSSVCVNVKVDLPSQLESTEQVVA